MLSLTRWRFFTSLGVFQKLVTSNHLTSPTSVIENINHQTYRICQERALESHVPTCAIQNDKTPFLELLSFIIIQIYPNASCRNYDCRMAKVIKYQSLILIKDFNTNPIYDNQNDISMTIIEWVFFIPAVECPGSALWDLSMPGSMNQSWAVLEILWRRLVVVHLLELLCLVVEDVRHDESGFSRESNDRLEAMKTGWIRQDHKQINANDMQVQKLHANNTLWHFFVESLFHAPLQLVNFWLFLLWAITAGFNPVSSHLLKVTASKYHFYQIYQLSPSNFAFEFWSTSLGQFAIGRNLEVPKSELLSSVSPFEVAATEGCSSHTLFPASSGRTKTGPPPLHSPLLQ